MFTRTLRLVKPYIYSNRMDGEGGVSDDFEP